MNTKNLRIIKGDDSFIRIQRKDKTTGEIITTIPDKMYFTVKKSCCDEEVILQKTLDSGITFDSTTNKYTISISKDDTCDLMCCNYVYDIEIIDDNLTTTILIGELAVTKEVTYKSNEV